MYFEGKEQTSSIRCKCPPGGQSNFQFLYNDAQPEKCNFKKHPDSKSNYNILTLESKENNQDMSNAQRNCSIKTNYEYGKEKCNIFHNQFPQEGKQSSIKTNYETGNEKCNIFHNQFPQEAPQSSIRVTQMPGGNSHVRFAAQQ